MLTLLQMQTYEALSHLCDVETRLVSEPTTTLASIVRTSPAHMSSMLRLLVAKGYLEKIGTRSFGKPFTYKVLELPTYDKADIARLWSSVQRGAPQECWPWLKTPTREGYGRLGINGKNVLAHRMAYDLTYHDLQGGPTLDHLCHNSDPRCPGGNSCLHRLCCNPAHLKPRSRKDNSNASHNSNAAKTHCINGHEYTPENTQIDNLGRRACKTCLKKNRYQSRVRRQIAKGLPVYSHPGRASAKNIVDPSTLPWLNP